MKVKLGLLFGTSSGVCVCVCVFLAFLLLWVIGSRLQGIFLCLVLSSKPGALGMRVEKN